MNLESEKTEATSKQIAENKTGKGLDIDLSFTTVFAIFRSALREIFVALVVLLAIGTAYIFVATKQYVASGVIEQPDLSGSLQVPDTSGMSISKALLSQNDSGRISKYIVAISSPNIAQTIMRMPQFIKVLFGDRWVQESNGHGWVRRFGPGYVVDEIRCVLLSEKCPRYLSPEQVSNEISSRISIDPTVLPNQGLLGSTSTSYTVSLTGPDPKNLLLLLQTLHEVTNKQIQSHEVDIAKQLLASMVARARHTENNDARMALIQVLSAQEKQIAIMTASHIDYAADWVLRPTVSSWPVKPNIPLVLGLCVIGSIVIGIFLNRSGGFRKLFWKTS